MSRSRGLTLLELVVAIFVLALGSMAALRAVDQSRLVIGGADDRLLAQIVARNRAEALRLFGPAAVASLPARVEMGGRGFALHTEMQVTAGGLHRVDLSVRSAAGPGVSLVVFLPLQRGAP